MMFSSPLRALMAPSARPCAARLLTLSLLAVAATSWIAGPATAAAPATPAPGGQALAAPAAGMARLVPAASQITFTARQLGVPLEGRFKRFDAQVAFDPRQPQAGRVVLAIELGSIAIDPETDAELAKSAWFDTARFPRATFTSSAIRMTGPGRFEVSGTLGIKGQSKPLVVPVSLVQTGGQTVATGSFVIKRLDFKIGDGDWADPSVVANDVQVRFKLVVQGMAPL